MHPNLQRVKARLNLLETELHHNIKDGSFNIYKLEGVSQLGEPYEYNIDFISPKRLKVEELVDIDVQISLEDILSRNEEREIYGKVFKASEESFIADKYVYRLQVVHPLYYLKTTKRYEIYQDMSSMEIIKQVIQKYAGLLDLDFISLAPPRMKREYTTQYHQSDLAFIQMLCQEEGITLNLQGDKRNRRREKEEKFFVRLENISDTYTPFTNILNGYFNLSKVFRATHQEEDYYDFKSPSHNYAKKSGQKLEKQTLKDNPKTAQLRNDLKHYTLRDRLEEVGFTGSRSRSSDLNAYAKEDSIQEYAHSEKIFGTTHSLLTCDGHGGNFHEEESYRDIEVLITKVTYEGFFPNALEEHKEEVEQENQHQFTANFEAVPLNTLYIAAKTIEKPRIYSTVTARVSGGQSANTLRGAEDTVDVDKYSRIRVVFHFDPKYPTSCYMRFANFWSGNGWGSQFIPRVNTEVVVSFINGDPDRPHIMGSLYNAENQIPQELPQNKTQSYIKTRSMPGTPSEYNLLLFEDKQKQELLHLRAQKDYKLHALNNSYINIDSDQTEVVGNDESFLVKHDREKTIGHDEVSHIQNDQKLTVDKNQSNHIKVSQDTKIEKDQILNVGNHRMETTYANHTLETGGNYKHSTNGEYDLTTGTHIKSITKLHELTGSEKFVIKGKAGIVTIDGSGITLEGNVTIKGSLAVVDGKAPSVAPLTLEPNEGTGFDEKPKFFSEDGSVLAGLAYQLYSATAQHNGASKLDGNAERVHTEAEEDLEMEIYFHGVHKSKYTCKTNAAQPFTSTQIKHLKSDVSTLQKQLRKAIKLLKGNPSNKMKAHCQKWYGTYTKKLQGDLVENMEEMITYTKSFGGYTAELGGFTPGTLNPNNEYYASANKKYKNMFITCLYWKLRKDDKSSLNAATRLGHEFSHLINWTTRGNKVGKATNDNLGYHAHKDVAVQAQTKQAKAWLNADNFRHWLKGV